LAGSTRAPVREGAPLLDAGGREVGCVTSGSFGPSAGQPVAMAYVETASAAPGTELSALVRGRPVPMTVTTMPFVPQRYHRG
ncbi:MAG TPA: glycine cleavage T C-terminal barrel domain-containing protein, partial [Plasticicumulans sp.]|nr:glycine cleavage T C-terminal barrel domain-containing protein [Plasticicumulans sp.]